MFLFHVCFWLWDGNVLAGLSCRAFLHRCRSGGALWNSDVQRELIPKQKSVSFQKARKFVLCNSAEGGGSEGNEGGRGFVPKWSEISKPRQPGRSRSHQLVGESPSYWRNLLQDNVTVAGVLRGVKITLDTSLKGRIFPRNRITRCRTHEPK